MFFVIIWLKVLSKQTDHTNNFYFIKAKKLSPLKFHSWILFLRHQILNLTFNKTFPNKCNFSLYSIISFFPQIIHIFYCSFLKGCLWCFISSSTFLIESYFNQIFLSMIFLTLPFIWFDAANIWTFPTTFLNKVTKQPKDVIHMKMILLIICFCAIAFQRPLNYHTKLEKN